MRITRVKVDSFKNLQDFEIRLDQRSAVSVLVGRNGSGKSNLLEVLTIIFRDLDLGRRPYFAFELEYLIKGNEILITSEEAKSGYSLRCRVNGRVMSFSKFSGDEGRDFRPQHVFGYYSGPSNRLEEHFTLHQERFYKDLLDDIERPLRPLFYARNVHSNFVLLAFFLDEDPEVSRLLRDHLGIEGLDSVLFEMQKPSWPGKNGDERFWNARGTVRYLLDRLYSLSLAPMRLERKVRTGLSRSSQNEHLYLYLESLAKVRELRAAYASNGDFFKALESTYISELIHDVRIRVKSTRSPFPLTFRELSEGEQQLLLVLGLMRFTREEESLFLLDEPDTHLNPGWSVQYRKFLTEFGGLDEGCHVLMATHDPLVVAGLLKEDVRILQRGDDGRITAMEPLDDPQGMGVGALLTSDIYGLRSQLDLETLDKLDEKRRLSSLPDDRLTPEDRERLNRLGRELRHLGLLMEDRDPEFQAYLMAKSASRVSSEPLTFTPEEVEENFEDAVALLNEIEEHED
ncbi:AAA family ATPase [Streptomyces sp. MC1]|uniref:AAA family ATPase n=1 Tax=Streptomyces sp. MC1 TaxID=295105 RepID=UPI0018CAE0BD|nr:ATP-binding protein [Streptomyces sp. MC1]MBG7700906.1 AAA family ATPase [Streptomyces sp. MC1]